MDNTGEEIMLIIKPLKFNARFDYREMLRVTGKRGDN